MKKGHFRVFSGADKRGNGKETIIPVSGKEGIQMLRKILHPHTENYTCAFCAVISIGKDIPVAAYAIKPQPLPGIAVIVTCRRSERSNGAGLGEGKTVLSLFIKDGAEGPIEPVPDGISHIPCKQGIEAVDIFNKDISAGKVCFRSSSSLYSP